MSVPAQAPAARPVAPFRAGLARGVGAAAPAFRLWLGRGAPGEYRSPFPARLRFARAAIVVLALVWLAAGFSGLNATSAIVRTVGHDAAPSVSAAEAIRTGLSAANADFALSTLANEGADGASLSAMRLHLRAVRIALVAAAGNVTYGDEERGPIATLLQGLGEYEQLVGRSVASAGDARRDLAFAADDLLHWAVLPAAVTLERVNADHLAQDYGAYLGRYPVWWALLASTLLLAGLAAVQVDVARTAKRLVNPGLLAATLAVAAATALVVWRLLAAQADLRVAKADAFDSVYALSSAQALAADADAAQGFRLLAAGDANRAKREQQLFDARTAQLLPLEAEPALRAAARGQNPGGFLGDELLNVTFAGERDAAVAAVQAWTAVFTADLALHRDETRGDRAAAVASKTGSGPSGARAAFARFDAALAKVLAINEAEFAAEVAAAEGDDAPLGAALAAGFALAVACAWFGIGRRLDEYRF